MMIYRRQEYAASTDESIAAISRIRRATDGVARPDHSAIQELLISYGEFESAVVDALMPERDGATQATGALREAAVALGRLFSVSWQGQDCRAAAARFGKAFAPIAETRWPPKVRASVPEGYAFYGLFPERYAQAARDFAAERRPRRACVVGIRSIGTSLSAVVAGALAELGVAVGSFTARPHDHPFHRELRLSDALRDELKRSAKSGHFVLADEGPGLSGSSFLASIRALRQAGVPEARIAIFPSWDPDGSGLVNEGARAEWPRYRKYCAQLVPPLPPVPTENLSAGRWREFVSVDGRAMPAAQPQHEALKYLTRDRRLYKFSGLGRYGREKFAVAQTLAEAGYSPAAHSFANGFIEFDFVAGRPLSKEDATESFLNHVAAYIAFRAREFPVAERSIGFGQLLAMIANNSTEALGRRAAGLEERLLACRGEFERRPAVHVDGRMMPHEWIATGTGWLKTDSIDHSRDHFYPGQADPAWDLAAAAIEFDMTADRRRALLRRYRTASSDNVSEGIVDFYETAYLAFRLGYAAMAADATDGTPDGERFGALRLAHARALDHRLTADPKHRQVTASCA